MTSLLLLMFTLLSAAFAENMELVFEDNFESFDTNKWSHEITMWGGGNWEFQAYTTDTANTYTRNGTLFIKPTLTKFNTNPLTGRPFGEAFLHNGTWNLTKMYGYCTQSDNYGCFREGKYGILPPVMSGRIRTKGKFSFRYGRMEIEAKMPLGDWMWPAIWLSPEMNVYGGWPRSGEIDLVESRGNRDLETPSGSYLGIQRFGSTLHWGPRWNVNKYPLTHTLKYNNTENFGDNYHKFVLDWDENGFRFFVDDEEYFHFPDPLINENRNWTGFWDYGMTNGGMGGLENPWVNGTVTAPFDQEYHIVLNVAVGGTNGYFPDDAINNGNQSKPWTNTGSGNKMQQFWDSHAQWYPTWESEDAAIQVKWIRVYQKPNAGTTRSAVSATNTKSPTMTGPISSASLTENGNFQLILAFAIWIFFQIHSN